MKLIHLSLVLALSLSNAFVAQAQPSKKGICLAKKIRQFAEIERGD